MISVSLYRRELERHQARAELAPSGCLVWSGARDAKGYGRVKCRGRITSAHRLAYALAHGIPPGMFVLHRCDNPPCINLDHLFLGDASANMRDCAAKGRMRAQARPETVQRGSRHPNARLTEEDVRHILGWLRVGASARGLAHTFGVSARTIDNIRHGRKWRHVSGYLEREEQP